MAVEKGGVNMSKKSRKKKQAVRNIENHLRNYKFYKVGIIHNKRKLDMILPNITTNYEIREGSSGVFIVKSTTEDVVLCRLESRAAVQAHETIEEYQRIVDAIDASLKQLTEDEREYVKLRYFENYSISDLCTTLSCSERQVHRIRYNIINKLLIGLDSIKDTKY